MKASRTLKLLQKALPEHPLHLLWRLGASESYTALPSATHAYHLAQSGFSATDPTKLAQTSGANSNNSMHLALKAPHDWCQNPGLPVPECLYE